MTHLATDAPLSRSIVRAFLDFLNSVEPAPGVDVEGLEVAAECLTEAFKLNTSPTDVHAKSVSLVDIFKSLESSKQCEASQSDVGKQPEDMDASGSSTAQNADPAHKHYKARKSPVILHRYVFLFADLFLSEVLPRPLFENMNGPGVNCRR